MGGLGGHHWSCSVPLSMARANLLTSSANNDFLPLEEIYVRPMKRGPYKYWQAFGSDGMAGLYDFVKRAPGQREIRSSYGSFGAPNMQPSYDQYSSSWYRQPEVQRYSQPRTSYSRGFYNRAPYSNGYYSTESAGPSGNSYSAPRQSNKKKTYQYWQGFGSDGLAGLYDF